MANHKSALKRVKQSENRRLRNKTVKTVARTFVKKVRSTVAQKSSEAAVDQLNQTKSIIDKAAKKGVIHKRAASRKISRLAKLVNSIAK
ncbi:MAG: 30S ribosomal protein S20 [Thermodesulfobacteriota bacterium]